MNDFTIAKKILKGDRIQLTTGKGWTRTMEVESIVKMGHAYKCGDLHEVAMRFTNGKAASMKDDQVVKIVYP